MSILIREVTWCDKFIRNILMAQVEKFFRDCKVESKKNVILKNPIKYIGLDKRVAAKVQSLFALLEKQILSLSFSGQEERRYRKEIGIDGRMGVSMRMQHISHLCLQAPSAQHLQKSVGHVNTSVIPAKRCGKDFHQILVKQWLRAA